MAPGTPAPHDGVMYRSRGAVLITGNARAAADAAGELARRAPKLRITLIVAVVGSVGTMPPNVAVVGGRIASLEGHLGRFSASLDMAVGELYNAGIFSSNSDRHFDLVLDLGSTPLLGQRVLPYGYYAPGKDAAALVRALDSLSQLTGDFHKPEYVDYLPLLCNHGVNGVAGCRHCLDACQSAAISPVGDEIEVDPYLCQGCAGCTLACPTGALEFRQPATKVLWGMVDEVLAARLNGVATRCLVIHDAPSRHLLPLIEASGVVLLEMDPLPVFSELLWLRALACGSGVALVITPAMPAATRALVQRKLAESRAIVASVGGDPAALQVTTPEGLGSAIEAINGSVRPLPAAASVAVCWPEEKRAGVLALVDAMACHWHGQAGATTAEPAALEPGATFGNVLVDPGKCTLCRVCADLCPTGALSREPDPLPVLCFNEALCLQCDLCRAGCPEQAIVLEPRFLPDAAARNLTRELARGRFVIPA